MKKRFALVLVLAFAASLLLSTTAYAAPGDQGNPGGNIQDRIERAQERLQFLETIQPLVQTMQENREAVVALREQLREQAQLARAHVLALRAQLDDLTDEQLALMQQLHQQLQERRHELAQTNPNMRHLTQQIRAGRRNRDYDSIVDAYNQVISMQQQRLTIMQQLIDINAQIAQI